MSSPEVPLLPARRAVQLQLGAYLAAGVVAVVAAAVSGRADLADWAQKGFIAPLIIATFLSVLGRPRRRLRRDSADVPAGARLATEEEARRLSRALFAVLAGLALVVGIVDGGSVLVIAAVGLAHAIALAGLQLRLGRLERKLGAPLYQRLSAAIWREPLYLWRAPGSPDPEVLAALGRGPTTRPW